jgi:RNA ligase (TIGR02306 family)
MRKLASIQKIRSLEPIDGADAIQKATVLGWQLVVKKGEFEEGDWAVYCEIDSLMPNKPEFEFLQPRGMRVRTIRLRGQISQGICFPLSILPPDFPIVEDADCTDILGITKYDPPLAACLSGTAKGKFPSFIPKTDETRVQVLQGLLNKYKGTTCFITEKLDGSSVTFFQKDDSFSVCSRNLELEYNTDNSLWKQATQLKIAEKLQALNRNIALQGEIVGEGIQGNKLQLKGQIVYFFNAFDIDKYEYLGFEEFTSLMQTLDLQTVPILATDYTLDNDIDTLVKMATMRSTLCTTAWAEGIVIRPLIELTDTHSQTAHGRISLKAINPEFLLKYGE